MRVFLFFMVVLMFISCYQSKPEKKSEKISTIYAKHFNIKTYPDSVVLEVFNPYQNSINHTVHYCLSYGNIRNTIHIPLQRIVILSTTHIGFLSALDKENSIVGISGTNYVFNPKILKLIQDGKIKETGYENSLNYELLLSMKPDVVFAYAVNEESLPYIKKIMELGIPVVYIAEYLENNPLGRAEWIKFFAVFFNELSKADSIFKRIEFNYKELSVKATYFSTKPSVLINLPLNDIWYLPGKNSYMAKLVYDAGGNYIFQNDSSAEVLRYNMETVFSKASASDYWINTGTFANLRDILFMDKRYAMFNAVKKGNIYNQLLKTTANGGNDFWESGVVYPNYILEDLLHIFHTSNDTAYRYHYYIRLK